MRWFYETKKDRRVLEKRDRRGIVPGCRNIACADSSRAWSRAFRGGFQNAGDNESRQRLRKQRRGDL